MKRDITELNIGRRLMFAFGLVVLLMSLGSAVALWQFTWLHSQAQRLRQADLQVAAVLRVHNDILTFKDALQSASAAQSVDRFAAETGPLRATFIADVERAAQALSAAEADSQRHSMMLHLLESLRTSLPNQIATMGELARAGDWQAVRLRLENQVRASSQIAGGLVQEIDAEVTVERARTLEHMRRIQRQAVVTLLATGLLTLLAAITLGAVVTRSIARPLAHLDAGARALARGDFGHQVQVSGRDELANLGQVFNETTARLHHLYAELQQRRDELAQKNDFLNAFFAHLPVAVFVKNVRNDLRIEFWNQKASELFGLTTEEAAGKSDYELSPKARAEHYRRQDRQAIRERRVIDILEEVCQTRSQPIILHTMKVPIFDREGQPAYLLGISEDITESKRAEEEIRRLNAELEQRVVERTLELQEANQQLQLELSERQRVERALRESEEHYRLLFESNPHPMWVYDLNTHAFLAVNQAAIKHYEYSRQEFSAMTIDDLRPHDESTDRLEPLPKGVNDSGGLKVWRHRKKDGGLIEVELTAHQLRFAGRPAKLVLANDITERRKLERQLRQAQKLESIGQLAAGIAHEINTPVQYLSDNTQFLQDAFADLRKLCEREHQLLAAYQHEAFYAALVAAKEAADLDYLLDEIPKAIQQSLEGAQTIARIVQSMKDFAHPGAAEKQPSDLKHAIESTVTVARNEWKYVADVQLDFDPELPLVPCLIGEFNQVILNIIINAAHAIAAANNGQPGKGLITISTRRAGAWAELRIGDTGTGIPGAYRDKIFDPFFTTKEVGKGTGQGLAISHAVVEKHGGSLTFETELGKGTTFIIRLPLEASSEHKHEPLQTGVLASAPCP